MILNLREEIHTQVRISNGWLLFDSVSLPFHLVSNIYRPTCSNKFLTLFVDVVIFFVLFFCVYHWVYVD